MWPEGALAFDHSVMEVARTEWLVYVWDIPTAKGVSFIIAASVFTPRGLFTYQIISFGDGCYKKAGRCGLTVVGKRLAVAGFVSVKGIA